MAAPKGFRRARTRRNPEVLKARLARRQRKAARRTGHPEGDHGSLRRSVGRAIGGVVKRVGKLLHLTGKSEEGAKTPE